MSQDQTERVVLAAIQSILELRSGDQTALDGTSNLYDDLAMDSLEIAQLAALLEDEFGSDPYAAGFLPQTIGEIVHFYTATPDS